MPVKECGAKTRNTGKPCKQKAMENGRCKLHGGKTPKGIANPNFKTGENSKYAYLPKTLLSRAEGLLTDTLKNLEESIQIQKTLETQCLEKLGTGESTEAWIKLKASVKEYDSAEYAGKNDGEKALIRAQAFGMIRFIVNEGLNEAFLRRDIQSIHDSQRKLTETLSKCRKEQQEIYTAEELNQIIGTFVKIVKRNITDRNILSAIQAEITTLQTGEDVGLIG